MLLLGRLGDRNSIAGIKPGLALHGLLGGLVPYILEKDRAALKRTRNPIGPGELNFLITDLCNDYVKQHPLALSKYQILNDVIGALECAKQEFYRRIVAPYEDQKRGENGDVY